MCNGLLKAALMLLGAACVLLFAGAFPLLGAESVYRGGAMLTLACAAALLCFWAAWRQSAGQRGRLLFGMGFLYFCVAGAAIVWNFGAAAYAAACTGGMGWMIALSRASVALMGCIFVGLFGFGVLRLMTRRLWLALIHLCLVGMAVGSLWDFCAEERAMLRLPAAGSKVDSVRLEDGRILPLEDFSLELKGFRKEYYGGESYSLAVYDAETKVWGQPRAVERKGDRLCLGGESWPLAELQARGGMSRPFLLLEGQPLRVLLQDERPVKSYELKLDVLEKKGERLPFVLRVNEPLERHGWQFSLMSCQSTPHGEILLLQARRAPGSALALASMIGLMISTAFYCWSRPAGNRKGEAAAAVKESDALDAVSPAEDGSVATGGKEAGV